MTFNDHNKPNPTVKIGLELDQVTFQLKITGEIPNTDGALALLAQATRYFELQGRAEAAKQMQRQALEQAENERIAQQIRRTV